MGNSAVNDPRINKIVNIILICIGAIIGLLLIDFLLIKLFGVGPFLAGKDKSSTDTVKIYNGIFYKAYVCDAKEKPHDVIVKTFGGEYDCDKAPVENIPEGDFVIQDETKACAEALQEIARDDRFVYYLSCMKSTTVFLKYGNGAKISIKEALAKKRVTIQQLLEKQDDKFIIYQEVIAK